MYKELRPEQIDILVGSTAVNDEFSKKIRELDRRLQSNGMSYRDWEILHDRQHNIFSHDMFLDGECATSVKDYVMGAVDSCWCPDVVEDLEHHSPVLMREIEKQQDMLPDMKVKIGESLNSLNETIDLLLENIIISEISTLAAGGEEGDEEDDEERLAQFNAELATALENFVKSNEVEGTPVFSNVVVKDIGPRSTSNTTIILDNVGVRQMRDILVKDIEKWGQQNNIQTKNPVYKVSDTTGERTLNGATLIPVDQEGNQNGPSLRFQLKQGAPSHDTTFKNVGNVQEAYVASGVGLLLHDPAATLTKDKIQSFVSSLVKQADLRQARPEVSTVIGGGPNPISGDTVEVTIGLDRRDWEDLSSDVKRKSVDNVAERIAELANNDAYKQLAESLYNNQKAETIVSVASGVGDQRGTKVDWYLLVDGQRVATRLAQLSIKGYSDLLGQRGMRWEGSKPDDESVRDGMKHFYEDLLGIHLDDELGQSWDAAKPFRSASDVYSGITPIYKEITKILNNKLKQADAEEEGSFLDRVAHAIRVEALGDNPDEGPVGFMSLTGDTLKFLNFYDKLNKDSQNYIGREVDLEVATDGKNRIWIYDKGKDGANLKQIESDAKAAVKAYKAHIAKGLTSTSAAHKEAALKRKAVKLQAIAKSKGKQFVTGQGRNPLTKGLILQLRGKAEQKASPTRGRETPDWFLRNYAEKGPRLVELLTDDLADYIEDKPGRPSPAQSAIIKTAEKLAQADSQESEDS